MALTNVYNFLRKTGFSDKSLANLKAQKRIELNDEIPNSRDWLTALISFILPSKNTALFLMKISLHNNNEKNSPIITLVTWTGNQFHVDFTHTLHVQLGNYDLDLHLK